MVGACPKTYYFSRLSGKEWITIKKIPFDKKYLTIGIYVLLVLIAAMTFWMLIGNIGEISNWINAVISFIIGILSPFIYGFFIAYFMNTPMRWLEKNVFSRIAFLNRHPKARRYASVLAALLLVVGFFIWIIAYLLPEIVANIQSLIMSLPNYLAALEKESSRYSITNESINGLFDSINKTFSTNYDLSDIINLILEPVMKTLATLPDIFRTVLTGTVNVASGLLNLLLGIVVSVYMLCEKENFAIIIGKILYTFLKKQTAEKLIGTAKMADGIFEKFIIGKSIDSLIIGIIFFIIAMIIKLPFALLNSLVIGVTNMIPYFGPFIGAIPVILITLLINPMMAVWITLVIFILQQFDGIILGPKILGDSTGMKPMGVIFSIIVGGALFGVPGMFFGVPVCAVLKIVLTNFLNRRYNEKYMGAAQGKAGRKPGEES